MARNGGRPGRWGTSIRVVVAIVTGGLAFAAACSSDGANPVTPVPTSTTVVTSELSTTLPRVAPIAGADELWQRLPEQVAGWLDADGDGCWTFDRGPAFEGVDGEQLVVFAFGSTIAPDGRTVTTPGGAPVTARALVEVVGRSVPSGRWPDGGTGRWADHTESCGRSMQLGASMFVIEEVATHRFDPTHLDPDELARMITSATLSPRGVCGYRLAATDPAQEIAVVVDPVDLAEPIRGELPDERIEVTVLLGELIRGMGGWEGCRGWLVALRLPVVSGTFEFTPPPRRGFEGTATLTVDGAVVRLPDRDLDLGRIELENTCYWCSQE